MSFLIQQNTESSVSAGNTDVSLNCGAGNKVSWRISAPAFHSMLSARKKKILEIRQQLIEGRYGSERLNIALDSLIEDLIAEDRIDHLRPILCQLK